MAQGSLSLSEQEGLRDSHGRGQVPAAGQPLGAWSQQFGGHGTRALYQSHPSITPDVRNV